MKKAPALITIAIIALAVAGIVFLSRNQGKIEIDPWQLAPATAIAVFETSRPTAVQQLVADSARLIDLITSLARGKKFTEPFLFCFQSTGKRVEWAAVLPRGFKSPLDTLPSIQVSVKQRSYENRSLYDLQKGNKRWATFANVEGTWVVSGNSLLVEEIVRQFRSTNPGFRNANSQLFNLSTVKQDDGNLYVNWEKASAFVAHQATASSIPLISQSMVLDLKLNGQNLQGNGFAVDTSSFRTLLSIFSNQSPVIPGLRKGIPDQFNSAIHFGFSDASLWFANRDRVYPSIVNGSATPAMVMEKSFGFAMEEFVKAIDDEMMYCRFRDIDELIVFELKEITKAQIQFDKIRRTTPHDRTTYADRTIITLNKENVLAPVVWPFDLSSPQTSYSFDENLLLISSSEEAIRHFIEQTDREQVLGKSITWNKYMESTLRESNLSIMGNSDGGMPVALAGLPFLNGIDKFSMQFYALRGNYYASTSVVFEDIARKPASRTRGTVDGIKLASVVSRGPWLVRNHQERKNELLVQDQSFNLYFLDGSGNTRWTKDVKAAITTEIKEIDYLKNGKIQYLFCSAGEIHLIDRLGKYLPGFPRRLDMKAPRWLSVVDYDNNRNYRIVVADDDGMILIVDKEGKALDGWNPKGIGRQFTDAPTHYRIENRDYYAAVTMSGDVNLFSRRGEVVKPFPVRLGFIPSGEIFCDGNLISVVSEDGTLIKLDPKGKKQVEEPIIKNITSAKFRLIVSDDNEDFIITRTERGNFAVFDMSGKLKFEIVNPLSDKIEVGYFRASNRVQLVVVRDVDQSMLYVLDNSGKMLTGQPIPASRPAVVDLEEEGVAKLVTSIGDNIEVVNLNLR